MDNFKIPHKSTSVLSQGLKNAAPIIYSEVNQCLESYGHSTLVSRANTLHHVASSGSESSSSSRNSSMSPSLRFSNFSPRNSTDDSFIVSSLSKSSGSPDNSFASEVSENVPPLLTNKDFVCCDVGGYDDEIFANYYSETADSESDFDEMQLAHLIQAVETHCVTGGVYDEEEGAQQTVRKRLHLSRKPEVKGEQCLRSNLKIQQRYREALQCVEEGILAIQNKLVESREELRLRKYQSKPNPLLEKLPNCPYFKDAKKFTSPMNSDTVKKKNTEGFNFQRLPATIKWQKWEMKLLDLSVRKEVFLALEQPLSVRKKHLEAQLSRQEAKGRPTKKTRRLLRAVNREVEELTARPMFEILYNPDSTIDWMKISTIHFKGKRSPEECEGMWLTNQNLKINREPWTKDEIDRLVLIAREKKNQDWEQIAEVVGNGRSAFQCALYQQLHMNHERAKWTPEADKRLTALIKENTKKGYINFEKVASELPGRTAKQVRRRWCDTLDPAIKKGDFTKTEDTILNTARFYHKLNFRQIASLLPGRTPNQLRCRYTRLEFINPKQPWCQTEDEKLLHLIRNNNQRNWNYMVKHFNDRNLQQLRARYHRLKLGAKLAGKSLMLLDPNYDPEDPAQRDMNYVPDYDKEQSVLTMKYIPVSSLKRMVNRKGRRGKKSRKPDPMDKEISAYFRNFEHIHKYGRDKINLGNKERAAVLQAQMFYSEALGVNYDWSAKSYHHLKQVDPVLYKDLKAYEDCHSNLLTSLMIKHEREGWDPAKKTLTTILPPCYGSMIGLRSMMLSKPIHEVVDDFSDEEKEERKTVEEKMEVKKFASKFGVDVELMEDLDTPPCTPHHSPQGEEKKSQFKTTPETSYVADTAQQNDNFRPETPLQSDHFRPETPMQSDHFRPETPMQSDHFRPETPMQSDHFRPETPLQSDQFRPKTPLQRDNFIPEMLQQSNSFRPETPIESDHFRPETPIDSDTFRPETPLQSDSSRGPDTPAQTAVHSAIPRGYKYKERCLTAEEGFRVGSAEVPIHVEETMMKYLLKKCAKLKKNTETENPAKTGNVKTPSKTISRKGTFLDFKSFLNILFAKKGEELEFEEIVWKLQANCVEEMTDLTDKETNNEKKSLCIIEIMKELENPPVFVNKEKKSITERLEELKNVEAYVVKMRQFYKYQLSCNPSAKAVDYYKKSLEELLENPEEVVKQKINYFKEQLQELESNPDAYMQKISSRCEEQLKEVVKCAEDLKKKKQQCEKQLEVLDYPEELVSRLKQSFEKFFEYFDTSEEMINKITQSRPSITDFVQYGFSQLNTEEGSDVEWEEVEDEVEGDGDKLSFETALSLWCQRFISIFYMPAVMSMLNPPEDVREDLFEGERLACVDSDEVDTEEEGELDISSVTSSNSAGVSAKSQSKGEETKQGESSKYDLSNPLVPEEERKEVLLEKWLRYRQYKIRELEERKKRGLKDQWDEEQERFEAIDREANREMVERIPGKRGRPRRLRRRRKPIPANFDDDRNSEDDPEIENIFLQQPPASLEICTEMWTAMDKFKTPVGTLVAPPVFEDERFTIKQEFEETSSEVEMSEVEEDDMNDGDEISEVEEDDMNDGDEMSE